MGIKKLLRAFWFFAFIIVISAENSKVHAAAGCTTAALATGSDPATATIAPGSGIADRGVFTITVNGTSCTKIVSALTVTLAGSGTPYIGLAEVSITSSNGSTTYFSAVTSFSSNSVSFSGGPSISLVKGTTTTYKIRVTPLTHANMPTPPGASYAIAPYVSAWTTDITTPSGSDTNPNTTTIDNASPNAATGTSGSAGTGAVTLNWTTSNSSDFATTNGSVVLRWVAASAGNAVPAEGNTSYVAGNTIVGGDSQTATVACVISSAASTAISNKVDGTGGSTGCNTSALAGGTSYSYKVFQVDTNGNYDVGVTIGTFLTKPDAPTNMAATDGTYGDKVTVTWTKSTGATNYHVWRDTTDLGAAGDVATYDDTGAGAPTITAGSAVASDGTSATQVDLSLSGTSLNNGTTHTYKVVASNATGNSVDSATDTGYRKGSLAYQWQRSAADSDLTYSDISGATAATYADTGAPADGSGRYYKCNLSATGASPQTSSADRGYMAVISISITSSGTISYGTLPFNTTESTIDLGSTQTAKNDGNAAEDFTIKTSNAIGGTGWTLGSSAGTNIFVHEFYTATIGSWTKFSAADTYSSTPLVTNIAANGTQNFDLRLTTPTSSDAVSKSITVTILATQH